MGRGRPHFAALHLGITSICGQKAQHAHALILRLWGSGKMCRFGNAAEPRKKVPPHFHQRPNNRPDHVRAHEPVACCIAESIHPSQCRGG